MVAFGIYALSSCRIYIKLTHDCVCVRECVCECVCESTMFATKTALSGLGAQFRHWRSLNLHADARRDMHETVSPSRMCMCVWQQCQMSATVTHADKARQFAVLLLLLLLHHLLLHLFQRVFCVFALLPPAIALLHLACNQRGARTSHSYAPQRTAYVTAPWPRRRVQIVCSVCQAEIEIVLCMRRQRRQLATRQAPRGVCATSSIRNKRMRN